MLFGLLIVGLLPVTFLSDAFSSGRVEYEPDENLDAAPEADPATANTGDFFSNSRHSALDDSTNMAEPSAESNGSAAAELDDTDDRPNNYGEIERETILKPDDSVDKPSSEPITGNVIKPQGALDDSFDGTVLDHLLKTETDAHYGSNEFHNFLGTTNDILTGEGTNDDYALGENGGSGDGTLTIFHGTPLIQYSDGVVDVVDGQSGDDTLSSGDHAAYLFGGEGNDEIHAGDGATAGFGGVGNDTLTGSGGDAYLDGGSGDDLIEGGDGDEYLFGGAHEALPAEGDDDTIDGGDGNDTISGGYGADVLLGGDGDDVIDHLNHAVENSGAERAFFDWHFDGETDVLDGGAGDDTIIMDHNDIATGGTGADNFELYFDYETADGASATVTDFVPGEDFLKISLNPDLLGEEPELSVAPSDDGEDSVVTVNGDVVAVLKGAPYVTADDIYIEIQDDVYA